MKIKTTVDYYKVTLPSDLIQEPDQWLEQMSDLAINEARESARLYCIPAMWDATLIEGGPDTWECTFRVRRRRAKRSKV